jgi:hypothetical protein
LSRRPFEQTLDRRRLLLRPDLRRAARIRRSAWTQVRVKIGVRAFSAAPMPLSGTRVSSTEK